MLQDQLSDTERALSRTERKLHRLQSSAAASRADSGARAACARGCAFVSMIPAYPSRALVLHDARVCARV